MSCKHLMIKHNYCTFLILILMLILLLRNIQNSSQFYFYKLNSIQFMMRLLCLRLLEEEVEIGLRWEIGVGYMFGTWCSLGTLWILFVWLHFDIQFNKYFSESCWLLVYCCDILVPEYTNIDLLLLIAISMLMPGTYFCFLTTVNAKMAKMVKNEIANQ